MPAHEARKQIVARMMMDEQIRLDALCYARAGDGAARPLPRSDLINQLVGEAYERLEPALRERSTNAARLAVRPERRKSLPEPRHDATAE